MTTTILSLLPLSLNRKNSIASAAGRRGSLEPAQADTPGEFLEAITNSTVKRRSRRKTLIGAESYHSCRQMLWVSHPGRRTIEDSRSRIESLSTVGANNQLHESPSRDSARAISRALSASLTTKRKALPLPTMLSSVIWPPIICTNCEAIVKPSPVPPNLLVVEPSA